MKTLRFNYNWNNKLACNSFTTLRLTNLEKYKPGEKIRVILLNSSGKIKLDYGEHVIQGVKRLYLHQVNEYIARLDTGYSAEECRNIIRTMYKNKEIDWRRQSLDLVLLTKERRQKEQETLFNN